MESIIIKEYADIQYVIKNNRHWLYNLKNDRLIVSNNSFEEYLPNIYEKSNPLNGFYSYKNHKFSIFYLQLIRIVVKVQYINFIYRVMLFLLNKYLIFILLLFNICAFFLLNINIEYSLSHLSVYEMLMVYAMTTLIILPLHEYAHFSVYYKYFKVKKIVFGFSLRYLSMPVFFIKVPFYKVLERKKQNELILAGIKFQIVAWFLLTILYAIFPTIFIASLLVINVGIIMTNLLPFLKLDGYWYFSNILKVEDYMVYFRKMFSKGVEFKINVFLFGIINMLFIITSFILTFQKIFNFFN